MVFISHHMARVYISSSFDDLREQRQSVRDAVSALNHQPVGMETYSASSLPSLEYCQRDVRSCQIYIGILAWRYGSLPKGTDKSYTHLEFEEAVASKLRILIFLLHEEAPWPTKYCDFSKQRIMMLREQVSEDRMPAFFRSSEELKFKIAQAFATPEATFGASSSEGRQIPDLLPFLADLDVQEFDLHKAIECQKATSRRPIVCVVHGNELQSHEMIARRFEEYSLRNFLSMQPKDPAVSSFLIKWPVGSRTEEELHQRLQFEVTSSVLGRPAQSEELLRQLSRIPGPVTCKCFLATEDFLKDPLDPIDRFLSFWDSFPDLERDQVLIIFLYIKLQYRRGFLTVLSKASRRLNQTNEKIEKDLQKLAESGCGRIATYKGITGRCLSSLAGVSQRDAENWASLHASKFAPGADLIPPIRSLFEKWRRSNAEADMPMEIAAAALRALLFSFNHCQGGVQ
jgi:hypothetical protein